MASSIITAIIVFVVLNVLLVGFVLWLGPRRGHWNQPAAALRAPGVAVRAALYTFALAHLVAGFALAATVDGAGFGIVLVTGVAGLFYVGCAECIRLAGGLSRREAGSVASDD